MHPIQWVDIRLIRFLFHSVAAPGEILLAMALWLVVSGLVCFGLAARFLLRLGEQDKQPLGPLSKVLILTVLLPGFCLAVFPAAEDVVGNLFGHASRIWITPTVDMFVGLTMWIMSVRAILRRHPKGVVTLGTKVALVSILVLLLLGAGLVWTSLVFP